VILFLNRFTSNKRCILVTLCVGLLIGIVICGVPLAVMTTLYLQESKFNHEY